MIGARNVEKAKGTIEEKGKVITCIANTEAISSSDVIILAVPGSHQDEGIKALAESLGDCSGKTILDATNPLSAFQDGLQVRWNGTSAGEVLQDYLPSAAVFKAFNTMGVEHMATAAGKDCLFAGNDAAGEAKAIAAATIEAVAGFRGLTLAPNPKP